MKKRVWGVVLLSGAWACAGVVLAGRPLAIDDADPVDPGCIEAEAGAQYEYDDARTCWEFPFGLTFGALPGLEVGAGFGGQFEERTEHLAHRDRGATVHEHGVGDLALGAKWQFLPSCPLGARHALAPSVKLPTADEDLGSGRTDYDLTWIASAAIGEKAGAHVNVGYSWIGGPDDDVLHYGLALDYQGTETLQWVGEVFGEQTLEGDTDPVILCHAGLRWSPIGNLTVDLAGGSTITGDAPDFTATAGMTWTLGPGGQP